MSSVKIGGEEYILRCDLNSIAELQEHCGSMSGLFDRLESVKTLLFSLETLINEQFYYVGSERRVTAKEIGAAVSIDSLPVLRTAVLTVLSENLPVKKNPEIVKETIAETSL